MAIDRSDPGVPEDLEPEAIPHAMARGGLVMLVAQAAKLVLLLGSTAILARLLAPEDFGLVAMVTVITGLLAVFRDAGLTVATVQEAGLDQDQVSTLFAVNVALGLGLAGVVVVLSPVAAWFYGEPRVVEVGWALSGLFVLGGLTVQHRALIRRQMRFGALAAVEIMALLAGVLAGVVAAIRGMDYWALVVMKLIAALVTACGVWTVCGWRPGLPRRGAGVRHLLAMGGFLTGTKLVRYLGRTLDRLLIGRSMGAAPLGLYGKAHQLLQLPLTQVHAALTGVTVPALSRVREDGELYRTFFRSATLALASIAMPMVIFLAVAADTVVLVVLGAAWLEVVPMVRALCAVALVGSLNATTGWVYTSLGRTRRQLAWTVLASLAMAAVIAIALQWGVVEMAWSLSGVAVALHVPGLAFCFRGTHVRLRDVAGAVWRPALAAAVAASGLLGLRVVADDGVSPVLMLGAEVVGFALAYCGTWFVVPGGFRSMRAAIRLARGGEPVDG